MVIVSLIAEPLPQLPKREVESFAYTDMHGEEFTFQTGDHFTFGYSRDKKTGELTNWGTECFCLLGLAELTVEVVTAVPEKNTGKVVFQRHLEPYFECRLVQAYQHRFSPTCETQGVIRIAASVLAGNRKFTRTLPTDPVELRKAKRIHKNGRS